MENGPERVSDGWLYAGRVIRWNGEFEYKRYLDDFPCIALVKFGTTRSGASPQKEGVRRADECESSSLPPDVYRPRQPRVRSDCGSGTTAYVAEQWGRRWITCDTSRVAITLAKQRLMTADFDYYTLAARPRRRQRVRVQDGSARDAQVDRQQPGDPRRHDAREIDAAITKYAEQETLYDQPEIDRTKARVTGPFTVEAVPAVTVRPIETAVESRPVPLDALEFTEDVSVARYGETYGKAQWRDELRAAGIRGRAGSGSSSPGWNRWRHALAPTPWRNEATNSRRRWSCRSDRSTRRWSSGR